MPLVVDASVTASWYLSDEDDPVAWAALEQVRDDGGRVPHIWWYEVRNAFLIGERKARLRPSDTSSFLQQLEHLPIRFEGSEAEGVVSMARRLDLTCYDAAYVELSARLALPLATLDRRLAAAADRAGVTLFAK